MKGQAQALTAVLITTVTVGAVASAYVWGTPLLEKREQTAQLDQLESRALDVYEEIVSVARSGKGTASTIDISTNGRLIVDPEKDFIQIFTDAPSSPYASGSWTKLRGGSLQNTSIGSGSYAQKGEDLPGVVLVKSAAGAGSSVITYRIEFRNLLTGSTSDANLEKIDLTSVGRKRATGDVQLLVSNKGVQTDSVTVSTGENMQRKKTQLEVDIQ